MATQQTADIRITANAAQAERELAQFASRVNSTAGSVRVGIGGIGGAITGLMGQFTGLAGLLGGGLFVKAISDQISLMDSTQEAAAAAGVSVSTYRQLGYAASFSGVEAATLGKALAKLGGEMTKAADGDPALRRLFGETLGVKVTESSGALRQTDAVLMDLADRFAAMEDGPRKTALAIEVFGNRAGPGLVPFLNEGRAGIEKLRGEFVKLHGEMDDKDYEAASTFKDNMQKLGVAADGLAARVANQLLPKLVDVSSFALQAAKDVGVLQAVIVTLGREMAKLVGMDELAQARKELDKAVGEAQELKSKMGHVINQLKADPGNTGAAQRFEQYKTQWAEIKVRADAAAATIDRLTAAPAPAPKPPPASDGDGKLGGTGSLAPAAADNRLQQWEAALARQRAAFARHQEEIGGLQDFGKQREADYWRGILDTLKAGDQQRTAVELRWLALQGDLRKQRFEGEQAALLVEADALRASYAEREAVVAQWLARIGQKYGEDSTQYQAALRQQQALLRQHEEARLQIQALRRQRDEAEQLAQVADIERMGQLEYALGNITQIQLLQLRATAIERRRDIELAAKQAELEAMQGNPNSDPVALEKLQNELAAIRARYKGLSADAAGDLSLAKKGEQDAAMSPFERVFGVGEQQLMAGMEALVTRGRITLGGLGDAARQVGLSMLQELALKPLAGWLTAQARMVVMTWLFGKQKVAAEAVTSGQIGAIQSAASLKTIAAKAYEAAAGAYAAIAGIPYVGPVLAPVAAGVALAGVMAFAKRIFSAEGGFDIPAGINPVVQTHAREMILPARHADTIRSLGEMFQSGQRPALGGPVQLDVKTSSVGDWLVMHRTELLRVLQSARRDFAV